VIRNLGFPQALLKKQGSELGTIQHGHLLIWNAGLTQDLNFVGHPCGLIPFIVKIKKLNHPAGFVGKTGLFHLAGVVVNQVIGQFNDLIRGPEVLF